MTPIKKTSPGIGTVPMIIAIVIIFILFFVFSSGENVTDSTVSTSEIEQQTAKDIQQQVTRQQADAMFDAVQKADPRFGAGEKLDNETKRQVEQAQQFQNNF